MDVSVKARVLLCVIVFTVSACAQRGGGNRGGGSSRVGGIGGTPPPAAIPFPTLAERETPPRRKALRDADFTYKVDANLVTLDLIAVDKAGKTVTDLKPEDLEIFDEGKKQTISRMTLEKRDVLQPSDHIPASPAPGEAATYSNISASKAWNGQVTVLVLDTLNTPLEAQPYARAEVVRLMAEVGPQQPIAIYALGRKLTLLQDFTSDPKLVRDAARKLRLEQAGLQTHDPALYSTNEPRPDIPLNATLGTLGQDAEEISFRTEERIELTIAAFKSIARHVAGYTGRKNLVWLSSAFPLQLMADWQLPDSGPARIYYQDLHDVGALLASENVAVYPVDAEGLKVMTTYNPSNSGRILGRVPNGSQQAIIQGQVRQEMESLHDTMNEIAEQTGGHAYYNRNDLGAAIATAMADGTNYYAISFVPRNYLPDGKLHDLKVKTRRSGVQLRYRRGYFAVEPAMPGKVSPERQKIIMAEMREAMFGAQQLFTGVPFSAVLDTSGGTGAELSLGNGSISVIAENNCGKKAMYEIVSATFDAKGKPLSTESNLYAANLTQSDLDRWRHKGMEQKISFARPVNAKRLRIGVRDLVTDRIGTVDVPLDPVGAASQ